MNEWPETDESLILRVKDSADAAAWSDFLAIYRPVVVRMACGRGLQHADADDLAQQVFLSVARATEDCEPSAGRPPFRAWLARITRNAIVNALTRHKPDAAGGSTTRIPRPTRDAANGVRLALSVNGYPKEYRSRT
jgi:RNA polymerase sigma-70 factor, ECF subfamily